MDATHEQGTSDIELLEAISGSDVAAFEQLYHRYEQRVFQYVSTFLRDRTTAEEVTSETLLAVWHGANSFARTSKISTWILGIARHKALDSIRRGARRQREVELDMALDVAHSDPNPIDQIQQAQMASLTRQAMSNLSLTHQEILRLAFYEELSYEEIATLLGVPINTVKTRVFYAKQQLKHQLSNLHHGKPVQ